MLLLLFPLLFFPFLDSCLLVSPTSKCQCPPIGYIGQARIANSEYGSYLANRTTTRPKVRVSDECLIMADVSALHTPNHFLMLFRTAAPPIFSKRLSESSDKIINLTDIYCVGNNDGQFNWMYYGGVVNDLSVAVQSNEGMCECADKWRSNRVTISNQTSCDIFEVQCNPINWTVRAVFFDPNFSAYAAAPNRSLVVEDLTCVSGSWYYASYKITPYFYCYTPVIDTSECGCLNFRPMKPGNTTGNYTYAEDGSFADYTLSTGVETYTGCRADVKCAANQTLVIFSLTSKPLIYPPGTTPTVTCASSSLASNSLSIKQLYVDGLVVSEPRYGCYEKRCPCAFAFLRSSYIQNYVGNHPFLQNITSVKTNHVPYTVGPLVDYCPTYMECFNWETLVNLETNETARVIATEPYQSDYVRTNLTCSASTGNWIINGEEHSRLYAICVDYFIYP